jgi:hypothetical protein
VTLASVRFDRLASARRVTTLQTIQDRAATTLPTLQHKQLLFLL